MNSEETFLPESPTTVPSVTAVPASASASMNVHGASNGVNKCGNCGSSDVNFNGSWLECAYCHHRWNTAVIADELHLNEGIESLVGTSVLSGAKNIDTSSLVTVECTGCGAMVTINSETTLQATCHWCRHNLSLNKPVDNGAVPDAILPFSITREDAQIRMSNYASERLKYASADFRKDFATALPQAVYLPYLVADVNATTKLKGRGWVAISAQSRSESQKDMEYTTEEYVVTREADLAVDDLPIEARSTRSRPASAVSTANIISAIQPFDVANAVRFDASYVANGVAFEKRDLEVSDAMSYAADHVATIARGHTDLTLIAYTGGVRWDEEQTIIKGSRWLSVLLPVWLYAYTERTPTGPMMHYIAVNGRTGETEGSVPLDAAKSKRSAWKWGLATAGVLGGAVNAPALISDLQNLASQSANSVDLTIVGVDPVTGVLFLGLGLIVGKLRHYQISVRQRNAFARFAPESETTFVATRMVKTDARLGEFTHRGGPEITGRNDQHPELRAEHSKAFLGGAPVSVPGEESGPVTVAWNPASGMRFDVKGNPWAGQMVSASPPGAPGGKRWALTPGQAKTLSFSAARAKFN
jgi:hypothetical protein